MSSPERVIQGVNCRLGALWDMPGGNKNGGPLSANPPVFAVPVRRAIRWGARPPSSCPGNRLRLAVDTEFAVNIAGVDLDRVRREEKPVGDYNPSARF